uniref:Cadherin domain-containing protein n=1 Tax=Anopheles epiroticus TaxID=199890 RepID=A0A182P0L8_9DIPT
MLPHDGMPSRAEIQFDVLQTNITMTDDNDYIKKRFQTVDSLVELDREQQKQYLVPILIQDSGDKPMSAMNNLSIVIGDKNDNEMGMGESHIVVYNYEGIYQTRK